MTPASGCQDHTAWPSARNTFVGALTRAEHPRSHRIPLPTSVTIAKRPSCGGGTGEDNHVFPKNNTSVFQNYMFYLRPSRAARGAFRDRHGRWCGMRWMWLYRSTSDAATDGEVVWSWRLDAGVNSVTMLAHRTEDGDKKARSPERARRTPLKPLRRECRRKRRTCGD